MSESARTRRRVEERVDEGVELVRVDAAAGGVDVHGRDVAVEHVEVVVQVDARPSK